MKYECGMLVRSKAGHDKDSFFVIVAENGEYLYLADGVHKTIEHPKRKNKKHVQSIHKKLEKSEWSNDSIMRFLMAECSPKM